MRIESRKSRERELKPKEEMVNTSGPGGALSELYTSTEGKIHDTMYENLMEKVLERENMKQALRRVELNKGTAGIDGMGVAELRNYINQCWATHKEQLLTGTYEPKPVRRVEIPKADGGKRLLGIPTVLDRLIQQAVQQVLTPIFEEQFRPMSYGFRPKRSAHQAIKQAQKYVQEGYNHVVDIDLEKFFDRVNHDLLMERLKENIGDKRLLKLIRSYLQAGVMINGCCVTSEEGTPQGGPLSPLLANITLHELDVELEKRGHKAMRYADDINVYTKSKRAAQRVMASVTRFVEQRLKLRVNKEKSAAQRPWNRKILGYVIGFGKGNPLWIASKTWKRMKERIKALTRGNRDKPLKERIEALNKYMQGWVQYFKLAQMNKHTMAIDKWVRRRLRMCMLKQWKKPRTKLRKLRSLGIPEKLAYMGAYARHGPWRASKVLQSNMAMSKMSFENLGLMSLNKKYKELSLVL